jgi:hypothetical protein
MKVMELEAYEALADYSLQETQFYETPTIRPILSMTTSILSGKMHLQVPSNGSTTKKKMKKSVSFLPTFVEVQYSRRNYNVI